MGIRTVKPTSPARRYLTYVTYEEITKIGIAKGAYRKRREEGGGLPRRHDLLGVRGLDGGEGGLATLAQSVEVAGLCGAGQR